jgi:hypothetical protein
MFGPEISNSGYTANIAVEHKAGLVALQVTIGRKGDGSLPVRQTLNRTFVSGWASVATRPICVMQTAFASASGGG